MKRESILVFYPHNFYEMSSGTHRRIYDLLCYFKDRDFSIDLLSINSFTNDWNKEDLRKRDLFDSVRICKWKPSIIDRLRMMTREKMRKLPRFNLYPLRSAFKEMVATKSYAYILVSYVHWALLADEVNYDTVKVIDLHDCFTLNQFMQEGNSKFRLGFMFQEEIQTIAKFDYALSISEEETLLLSPFCSETKFVNVPISFPRKFENDDKHVFDLLFVGSDNPFNRQGMTWFMEKVYPLLPPAINIVVVGQVCRFLEKKENLKLIASARDLDEIYRKSTIVFCPLKGGTGLKVKVPEALSYGKPVVTTSCGLTGILQKYGNGCILADNENDFAEMIQWLLNDKDEYQRLSQMAKKFFECNFLTDVVYRNLDHVFFSHQGSQDSPKKIWS